MSRHGDLGLEGVAEQHQGSRCQEDHCITCGDVAVAMRVLAIDSERELALCRDERGRRETVEIALVQPVTAGDELLVHAGTAISSLTPQAVQA